MLGVLCIIESDLQIGLGIIEAEGRSMQCYESAADALSLSVMGASAAILKANYSIDSFMARYRRVDWLDKKNWGCNQRCVLLLLLPPSPPHLPLPPPPPR